MKKLLLLLFILPFFAQAQWVNGTFQFNSTSKQGRYIQGTELDTLIFMNGAPTNGYVPVYNSTSKKTIWTNPTSFGFTNPMTSLGDMIIGLASGVPARIGLGTAGQLLQVNGGQTAPQWFSPNFILPADTSVFARKTWLHQDRGILFNQVNGDIKADTTTLQAVENSFPGLYFTGKTITFFGTSITLGFRLNPSTRLTDRYSAQLCKYLGAIEHNIGAGGSCLKARPTGGISMFMLLDSIPVYDALTQAMLSFEYGVNDAAASTDSTTVQDFSTQYDSVMNYAIHTKGWPANHILLMQPSYVTPEGYITDHIEDPICTDARYIAFANAVRNTAFKWGTLYVNLYQKMIDNGGAALIDTDGLHPILTGHTYMANAMSQYLAGPDGYYLRLSGGEVSGTTKFDADVQFDAPNSDVLWVGSAIYMEQGTRTGIRTGTDHSYNIDFNNLGGGIINGFKLSNTGDGFFKSSLKTQSVFLTNITDGANTDSTIVKKSDNKLYKIAPLSTMLGSYLPLSAGSGNALTGTLYLGAPNKILNGVSAGTDYQYLALNNTGSSFDLGIESSTGGSIISGSAGYSVVMSQIANAPLYLATSNIIHYTMAGNGNNTWTGSGTFAGSLTAPSLATLNSTFTSTITGQATANRVWKLQNISGTVGDSARIETKAPLASPVFTGTVTTPKLTSASGLRVLSPSGSTSNIAFNTNDYVQGTTGTDLFLSFGAASGNTYTALNSYTQGEAAFGDLHLQDGGGKVIIGTLSASSLLGADASKGIVSITALPPGTTATTQSANDNSTKVATTAYADVGLALKANLASPTFTGTVTIPSGSALATPTTLVGTNITGTIAGLTAVGLTNTGSGNNETITLVNKSNATNSGLNLGFYNSTVPNETGKISVVRTNRGTSGNTGDEDFILALATGGTLTERFRVTDQAYVVLPLAGKINITEGTNGSAGQTTLVAGTKAITITGITTSTRAFVSLVSQGGVSTGVYAYVGVCTANTLTISADNVTGALINTDTSVVNYWVEN